MRALIVPNLKEYEEVVKDAIDSMDEGKKNEGEMVINALLEALVLLEEDSVGAVNGFANGQDAEMKEALGKKIGDVFAERVLELGKPRLVKAIMEC